MKHVIGRRSLTGVLAVAIALAIVGVVFAVN